jgi:hypothetical protein
MIGEREISGFEAVFETMRPSRSPWWVIGPAAAALYGIDVGDLERIDVVVAPGDARALEGRIDCHKERRHGTALLRARTTLATHLGAMPVIFHSWLEARFGGEWRPLKIETRKPIEVGEALIPVPARDELAAMLAAYGTGNERALAKALN